MGHLGADELRKKLAIRVFLLELAHVHGAELDGVEALAELREIDLIRLLLPVHDALLLHVERNQSKFSDSRFA